MPREGRYFEVPLSDFCSSWLDELELSLLGVEGVEDGVEDEVAPLPAEPLGLEVLGVELEDDAPPPAWSFFCMSDELEDEDEPDGLVLDGLDGVLVAPDEDEPDGLVLDGLVDDEPVAALLPPLSHAVSRLAPSAIETATAMVESLM